ncbi:glycosyltransferase, partial [Streptomyces sp. SID10244]|nr:glycosyltransferase [Streptomyces sp. SID10244]
MGFEHLAEEFVVRIDADTVIGPGCLDTAMRHFANPRVGCVGGMPMPMEEKTWIDKCRLIEVYMRHGFFQVSLDGYRGVMGIPGMFAIYRRSQVVRVGGIVQGMNGEDTDICMRLAAAGYRNVADPQAVYYSETPVSFAHLREQRTR